MAEPKRRKKYTKDALIMVRITSEMHQQIGQAADEQHLDRADWIRATIQDSLGIELGD